MFKPVRVARRALSSRMPAAGEQSGADHHEREELWEWQCAAEGGVLAYQEDRGNEEDDRYPAGHGSSPPDGNGEREQRGG